MTHTFCAPLQLAALLTATPTRMNLAGDSIITVLAADDAPRQKSSSLMSKGLECLLGLVWRDHHQMEPRWDQPWSVACSAVLVACDEVRKRRDISIIIYNLPGLLSIKLQYQTWLCCKRLRDVVQLWKKVGRCQWIKVKRLIALAMLIKKTILNYWKHFSFTGGAHVTIFDPLLHKRKIAVVIWPLSPYWWQLLN